MQIYISKKKWMKLFFRKVETSMKLGKYSSYKMFLRDVINENSSKKGYQLKLSQVAKCQQSYISKVINSDAHLNPEQTMRLCEFFKFNDEETEFFFDLVQLEKTNYLPLKQQLLRKVAKYRSKSEELSNILKTTSKEVDLNPKYYATWFWMAIHMATGIAKFQNPVEIAKGLNLSLSLVMNVLKDLQEMELIQNIDDRWCIHPAHLHLPKSSYLNQIMHSNWRSQASLIAQTQDPSNLHYTVVQSHAEKEFKQIKETLLELVEKNRAIIKKSQDDMISCLNIDFFKVL